MKKLMIGLALVGLMATPAQATSWQIGFTVHTIRPTNVAVHYVLKCSNGVTTRTVDQRFRARTPLVRHFQPTLVDATSCRIHVVAWDKKPWARPWNPPAPVVESWAEVTP